MAHVVSHFSDKPPTSGKSLAHLKLCDGCLNVEKLLHAPGVGESRVIVLRGSYQPASTALTGLASVDAGTTSCRDPPATL